MLYSRQASAQTMGDYRSVVSGNWSDNTIWERYDGTTWQPATLIQIPSATDGRITIQNGTTVTVDAPESANAVFVEAGGFLQLLATDGSMMPLTISDGVGAVAGFPEDLVVNGSILLRGFRQILGLAGATAKINGTMTWIAGFLGINTEVSSTGVLTFTTDDFPKNLEANLNNNGVVNWASSINDHQGDIQFNNATFTNNGTLNEQFQSNNKLFNNGGTNSFVNAGVLNKTTAFTLSNTSINFSNTGTINGNGTLDVTGAPIDVSSGLLGGGNNTGSSINTLNIAGPGLWNPPFGGPTVMMFINGTGAVAGTNYDVVHINDPFDVNLNSTTLQITDLGESDPISTTYTPLTTAGTFSGNIVGPTGASVFGPPVTNSNTVTFQKVILPLNWGEFNALASNNTVQLTWTTLQEQNTSYFSIEYSTDGKTFSSIGTVGAAGNSSTVLHYHFAHSSPLLNGNNYYRLREFDLDGKSFYSSTRAVRFANGNLVKVLVGPNPTHDVLQLSVQEADIIAVLTDISGKGLRTWKLNPGTTQVSLSSLPVGMYQLVIYQKQQRIETQQIFKN